VTRACKIALGGIFLLLFIYLVLRAWYVEPLKDELLTFFNFVERGNVLDDEIIFDEANNHLLNSFAAHFMNGFGNGNFFLLRIPNLLAFPFFFFGVARLLKGFGRDWQRITALLAIVCVPFYLEYFAACRGYGLALAAFVWMIFFARKWLQLPKTATLALCYLSAWLAVFAILNYVSSALIVCAAVVAGQLVFRADLTRRQHLTAAALHIVFLLALLPFIQLAGTLREAGALYYGSLDGFWLVTAKSVLRYTLFYEADWLKYVVGALFALIAVLALVSLFRNRVGGFLRQPEALFYLLLAGNVAAIFILAKIVKVNYPEDRVAMHLVLLTLLLLTTLILRSRFGNLILAFSFFPVVFLLKANLDTSVISPDDRLNTEIYETARRQMGPEGTIAGYHTIPLMWTWMERKRPGAHTELQTAYSFPLYHDLVITRANLPEKQAGDQKYTLMAFHEASMFRLWKRKSRIKASVIRTFLSDSPPSDNEFLPLCNIPVSDSMRSGAYMLRTAFDLKLQPPYSEVMLVFTTMDDNGATVAYEAFYPDFSYGRDKKALPIRQSFIYERFAENEKEIRVYIWNRKRSNMYFYRGRTELCKISD
jgi:hypothetical protein